MDPDESLWGMTHRLDNIKLVSVTKGIPHELGKQLTLEEGTAVLDRALVEGLMPTIQHMLTEAEIFGVDKTKMLSICFCCERCCDVWMLLREGPERYWDLYNQRMPGLVVVVSEDCIGLGDRVKACNGGKCVITLEGGRAVILERCNSCGRCVAACPEGAIALMFDSQISLITKLWEWISERVKIE